MRRLLGRLVPPLAAARNPAGFGCYDRIVGPAAVMPQRHVPAGLVHRPPYADTGEVPPSRRPIINGPEDIAQLRLAGRMVCGVLDYAQTLVQIGVTTDEIDSKLHQYILDHDLYPSPLNYRHFPKSVCTSVNNVVCHGIPDLRPLADGDIINIDVTVFTRAGYHGDSSRTFLVGDVDEAGQALVQATHSAMMKGIEVCKPGKPICAIGSAIEDYVTPKGLSTNGTLCGHGINRDFHTDPLILHCRNNNRRRMEPGMVFTIEPIINQGASPVYLLDDGWTVLTKDGGRSAQFEHMVLITDTGAEILTM